MKFEEILLKGGIGVMPTDTIYGIVGSALSRKTVERIYRLRRRRPDKPMIVLIGSQNDVQKFGVIMDRRMPDIVSGMWPGKVSIIMPVGKAKRVKFGYLHRGTNSLAFRLPAKKSLQTLLKKTGPLVAPSANFEGAPFAKTVAEAKKYFGNNIDFYRNGGTMTGKPSKLVKIKNGKVLILRK